MAINECSCRAHLICFLSLWDHYPLLPDVQCLENLVSCILSGGFLLFQVRGQICPVLQNLGQKWKSQHWFKHRHIGA